MGITIIIEKREGVAGHFSEEQKFAMAASILGVDLEADDGPGAGKKIAQAAKMLFGVLAIAANPRLHPDPAIDEVFFSEPDYRYRSDAPNFNKRMALERQRDLLVDLMTAVIGHEERVRQLLPGVQLLSRDEAAAADLRFSSGTPSVWTAYQAHPFDPKFQVPVAQFHDFMLHDKKGEFLRIASALGARRISVVETDRRESAAGAAARASTPTSDGGSGQAGFQAGFQDSVATDFSLHFENDSAPTSRPSLPPKTRWLQGEPLWQAMAEMRLQQWTTKVNVSFSYSAHSSVTAELAMGLSTLGISIGGKYRREKSINQNYLVEFWPRAAYGEE